MSQRLRELDWVGLALWIFRAVIIFLVIYGIVRKVFFNVGLDYTTEEWIDFLGSGLSQGALYALIALGYTMVYGILFMINFAHGEFFMSGAMTATVFLATYMASTGFMEEFPWIYLIATMIVSMIVATGIALLTERVAYRPLRRAPRLVPLITAIGMSLFWQYFFRGLYGGEIIPFPVPEAFQGRMNILGIDFLRSRFVVIVAAVLLLIALNILVMRTKTGKAIRAVAEDKDVAALMGINVDRTIALTFGIGAAFAGAAGILWALVFRRVDFFMGFVPGIKAFTAAVLGGIGSIPGAAVGGLFLGVIEAVGPPLILEGLGAPGTHQLKDVTAFTLLVLVLIFRPQGIVGERLTEKKA